MSENVHAYSAPFEWKGTAGEFSGIVFGDTERTYNRVVVHKRDPETGVWCHYHMWESRDPKGNVLAEFEAWRFRATGHEPNEYLSQQPEYAAEIARWVAAAEEQAYHDAYLIAWIGSPNRNVVERRLERAESQLGPDHVAVRAMRGHLAFLRGEGLGPDDDVLDALQSYAEAHDWPTK